MDEPQTVTRQYLELPKTRQLKVSWTVVTFDDIWIYSMTNGMVLSAEHCTRYDLNKDKQNDDRI